MAVAASAEEVSRTARRMQMLKPSMLVSYDPMEWNVERSTAEMAETNFCLFAVFKRFFFLHKLSDDERSDFIVLRFWNSTFYYVPLSNGVPVDE